MNAKIEQPTFAAFAGAEDPAKATAKRTVCAAKIAEPPTVTSASRAAANNRAIQAAARAAKREETAKRKAEKAAEKAAKKANDAVNKAAKKAEKAAEREAKRAAKAAKKLPPKSWEATKAELAKILTAAAGKVVTAPKSTKGLIQINHLNQWIDRRRLPAYAASLRRVCEVRWEHLGRYPAQVFEAELRAVGGDEAIALAMLGVMYHDDRGDGLLYVPAFRSRGRLAAWQAAAAAAGVKASKVRAA